MSSLYLQVVNINDEAKFGSYLFNVCALKCIQNMLLSGVFPQKPIESTFLCVFMGFDSNASTLQIINIGPNRFYAKWGQWYKQSGWSDLIKTNNGGEGAS